MELKTIHSTGGKAVLNRLEMLRIFCTAAEAASFKEAAIRLGISPQAVTRAVRELEELTGELLFHRNTRRNHITEFGEQLAERGRRAVGEMDALFQSNRRPVDEELQGTVRITTPSSLGRTFLTPALATLGLRYPGLRLDVRLSDQIADVVDEQIDIGVRVGFFRDSRFVARRAGQIRFHVAAAPSLVALTGGPKRLQDLDTLPVTGLIDRKSGRPWAWYFKDGQQWAPRDPVFSTGDTDAELAAVLSGLAYGQLATPMVSPYLQSGQLVSVLDHLAPDPWGLYVFRPQRSPVPARIRLVFDHLVQTIAAIPDMGSSGIA
ncbi:LysR family transcriptional regulator [Chitinimonas sp.]|uniref:LysR family transcriptional regulator n=1 Tax=Chitinimonas sp. TaxID=1934313 RepID=UPI002F94C9F2